MELELEDMKAFNLTTLINTTECGLLGTLSSCSSLFQYTDGHSEYEGPELIITLWKTCQRHFGIMVQ